MKKRLWDFLLCHVLPAAAALHLSPLVLSVSGLVQTQTELVAWGGSQPAGRRPCVCKCCCQRGFAVKTAAALRCQNWLCNKTQITAQIVWVLRPCSPAARGDQSLRPAQVSVTSVTWNEMMQNVSKTPENYPLQHEQLFFSVVQSLKREGKVNENKKKGNSADSIRSDDMWRRFNYVTCLFLKCGFE